MAVALLSLRLLLASVLVTAAVGKLADRAGTRGAAVGFGVPAWLGVLLAPVELALAAGLVLGPTARVAAVVTTVLMAAFSVAIARSMRRGERHECHCFGRFGSSTVGGAALLRNAALAALAGVVAWSPTATVLAVVAAVVVASLQAAFSWQLLLQNGRLLARLEQLEEAVPARKAQVGDTVPDFSLVDLDGDRVSREDVLGTLLVFTDPGCGHCNAVLPAVGRAGDRVTLISSGGVRDNRTKAEEHGIEQVLLQADFEVAESLGIYGVPAAVLLDEHGRIAAAPANGTSAVLELLEPAEVLAR
jgi:peroxiredoxin